MAKSSLIQSNYLTSARYDYDVSEKRIIYHILLKLKNDLFKGIDDSMLQRDMDLTIDEDQLRKSDTNNNYLRDYRRAVKRLREKSFSIDLPDGDWIETGFLLRGQYRKNIGLDLTISRDIIGYLYDLGKGFTAMDATVAITLHSKYAQRFYEWCCRWKDKGKFYFTPDELKEVLGVKQPTKWIKQFVLEVAARNIKDLYDSGISDLYFDYEEKRGGRGRGGSVLRWTFIIHNRQEQGKPQKRAENKDYVFVVETLRSVYQDQPKIVEGILATVSANHETFKKFADQLAKIMSDHQRKPKDNIAGYIRSIVRSDYGFEENEQPQSRSAQSSKLPDDKAKVKKTSSPALIGDIVKKIKN